MNGVLLYLLSDDQFAFKVYMFQESWVQHKREVSSPAAATFPGKVTFMSAI